MTQIINLLGVNSTQEKRNIRNLYVKKKGTRPIKNNLIQKIKNYHERDPRSYWKMVDELRKLEQRNINDAEKIDPDICIQHYTKLL